MHAAELPRSHTQKTLTGRYLGSQALQVDRQAASSTRQTPLAPPEEAATWCPEARTWAPESLHLRAAQVRNGTVRYGTVRLGYAVVLVYSRTVVCPAVTPQRHAIWGAWQAPPVISSVCPLRAVARASRTGEGASAGPSQAFQIRRYVTQMQTGRQEMGPGLSGCCTLPAYLSTQGCCFQVHKPPRATCPGYLT